MVEIEFVLGQKRTPCCWINGCSPHREALGHFLHEEPWLLSVESWKQEASHGYFVKAQWNSENPNSKALTSHHWLYLPHFRFSIFILFCYIFTEIEREGEEGRMNTWVNRGGTKGERKSQEGFIHRAEPSVGLNPITLGSGSELKSRVGCSAD